MNERFLIRSAALASGISLRRNSVVHAGKLGLAAAEQCVPFGSLPPEYYDACMVETSDQKAFLRSTPFFGGLSDASLDLLTPMLVERQYEPGGTVFRQGEPGRSMFVVRSGRLSVTRFDDSERPIPMAACEPGDFFGEMTLIEMQNRSATVVAETFAVLYELAAGKLYHYYKSDVHGYVLVMQNINRELCRRLRRADARISELERGAGS